jgi:hypothetical protein
METPEIDDNGYPTEETIEAIEKWDTIKDAQGLFDYVIPIFCVNSVVEIPTPRESSSLNKGYGRFTIREARPGDRPIEFIYEVATGGWSGCEDAIQAMYSNHVFWAVYWRMSKRGGYYEFDKPREEPGKPL